MEEEDLRDLITPYNRPTSSVLLAYLGYWLLAQRVKRRGDCLVLIPLTGYLLVWLSIHENLDFGRMQS